MTRAHWRALAAGAVVLGLGVLFILLSPKQEPKPTMPVERPTLLLLTTLPIVFGEEVSLRSMGSPALKTLATRYRVTPISVTDATALAKGNLLLMAQPLAQPAEDLVALDQWARRGGRLLLLADPLLEWPSKRPLGDPLRPPPMFMDTGLLAHWGMRLDTPDERGPRMTTLDGFHVLTVSPGQLFGRCDIAADRIIARCNVGLGSATVIADADLLDVQDLGPDAAHNLDGVLAELARLNEHDSRSSR